MLLSPGLVLDILSLGPGLSLEPISLGGVSFLKLKVPDVKHGFELFNLALVLVGRPHIMSALGRRVCLFVCLLRLSLEADRCGQLSSEASELKHQLTSRDRVIVELNTELSSLQQQLSQLNTNYQAALQHSHLYQQTLYVCHLGRVSRYQQVS